MTMASRSDKVPYAIISLRQTKRSYFRMVTNYGIFKQHRMMIYVRILPNSTATVDNRTTMDVSAILKNYGILRFRIANNRSFLDYDISPPDDLNSFHALHRNTVDAPIDFIPHTQLSSLFHLRSLHHANAKSKIFLATMGI